MLLRLWALTDIMMTMNAHTTNPTRSGVTKQLVCLTALSLLMVPTPSFAHGGLIRGAFKAAGWVVGTTVKSIPPLVNFSARTVVTAASAVSDVNNQADKAESWSVSSIAGERARRFVKYVKPPAIYNFDATDGMIITGAKVITGKERPIDALKAPAEGILRNVIRR